jgi:hypothetical protein
MPPKKLDDYNKIRALWYKKLEKEGFKDIEDDQGRLKAWSSRFSHTRIKELYEDKQPYYNMATQFLNDYKFESRLEKIIWEYHANALSVRDITTILRKTKVAKTNRTTIWQTIKRLEEHMKRMYLIGYNEKYND